MHFYYHCEKYFLALAKTGGNEKYFSDKTFSTFLFHQPSVLSRNFFKRHQQPFLPILCNNFNVYIKNRAKYEILCQCK
jgi:hypothetical protein